MRSAKEIPREKIPWYPTVDVEKCTGCGACVEFCQHGVYRHSEKVEVVNPFNCMVGCSGCMSQCPEGAISFPRLLDLREILKSLREQQGGA